MSDLRVIIGSSSIEMNLNPTDIVIPIDAFRCNSTILTALGEGCSAVHPVLTVEEADAGRQLEGCGVDRGAGWEKDRGFPL